MATLYLWLKFIHVVAAFTFLMGHGVAVALSFQLKKETDTKRIEAMFDLSATMWPVYILSLLVLLLDGILISFLGHYWGRAWVWTSLIALVVMIVWMFMIGQGTYHPMRRKLGLPYMIRGDHFPPEPAVPPAEQARLLAETKPWEMLIIGYGGFILIAWLMMFKPF